MIGVRCGKMSESRPAQEWVGGDGRRANREVTGARQEGKKGGKTTRARMYRWQISSTPAEDMTKRKNKKILKGENGIYWSNYTYTRLPLVCYWSQKRDWPCVWPKFADQCVISVDALYF